MLTDSLELFAPGESQLSQHALLSSPQKRPLSKALMGKLKLVLNRGS